LNIYKKKTELIRSAYLIYIVRDCITQTQLAVIALSGLSVKY